MRKSSVPETDGQAKRAFVLAVKENLEVITGRRRNKITLPTLQKLALAATSITQRIGSLNYFSLNARSVNGSVVIVLPPTPPTQAECLALNDYVNAWAKSITALVQRLDE